MKLTFFDMTRQDLEATCQQVGVSPVHAGELFRLTYKRSLPWADHPLPKKLLQYLSTLPESPSLKITQSVMSRYDNSVKFLFELADGGQIESVLMPEKNRITLCLSSQVGCAQGCTFCHTGRMGLKRNLSTGEIVSQVVSAGRWISEHPDWLATAKLPAGQRITNIVFMGMGEPLDNVKNVADAITIFTEPLGLALGLRHISVSTAGHLDGLRELLMRHPNVRLALSLHTPFDSERSRLMPINRKWPLKEVLAFIRANENLQRNGVLIQYTLISGVNDSIEHAQALVTELSGIEAKINVIPLNEIEPSRFQSPNALALQNFRDHIHRSGRRVLVRFSKGQDIAAACGQLIA